MRIPFQHRDVDALLPGELDGLFVARVGVADDAHAGVGGEHALQARRRCRRCRRPRSPAPRGGCSRCPRRRRGGRKPRWRPPTALSSAFRIGQSAMASLPSFMPRSRGWARPREPVSRWSRPITMGALQLPVAHHLVDDLPEARPLAVARASRCGRAGPGT